MKIATYNVNSINARLPNLLTWLKKAKPDVVMLQEIKCEFNSFPRFDLQLAGYEARVLGQKSYNGVALLTRHKFRSVIEGLPGFEEDNARYIEAEIEIEGKMLRAASLYLPNGNPPYNNPDDESKFEYKLKWMDAFYQQVSDLADSGEDVVLGGDYNVILTDEDVYNPELFRNNALFRKEVRERFKAIEYLGFYDAFRLKHPSGEGYTFWDYSGKSLAADEGMRIDYLLLSPRTADRLERCETDKEPRMSDKPSDHTPLTAELKW